MILISGPIILMGIGNLLITDGHGYQITTGDGLLFITDVGNTILIMDGCGYPDTNGLLPGLAGVRMMIIMAGHPWDLVLV